MEYLVLGAFASNLWFIESALLFGALTISRTENFPFSSPVLQISHFRHPICEIVKVDQFAKLHSRGREVEHVFAISEYKGHSKLKSRSLATGKQVALA